MDIARLHKNADRLYAQFKRKDAVGELQKILRIEGRNFEALIKLARAHADRRTNKKPNSCWRKSRTVDSASAAAVVVQKLHHLLFDFTNRKEMSALRKHDKFVRFSQFLQPLMQ